MSYLYCIVITFAIQSVTLAAEACCCPKKYESLVSYQLINFGGAPGEIHVTEAKLNISVDYAGQKEAASVLYSSVDGIRYPPHFTLNDYLNGIQYVVQDGKCEINTLTQPMPSNCLTDGPTQVIKGHLGADNEMLPINQYVYTYPSSNVTQNIFVTEQYCYLVLVTQTMVDGRTDMQMVFSGMSVGIKNPDIFNVPDVCKQNVPHGKVISRDVRMRMRMFSTWF